MAWEWSHSQEAYDTALENLYYKPKWWLNEAYAEWKTENMEECKGQYNVYLKDAETKAKEELVEYIWEKASEQRTCENGGFQPWMCPYGCHTVDW